jgi:hypothetical protein
VVPVTTRTRVCSSSTVRSRDGRSRAARACQVLDELDLPHLAAAAPLQAADAYRERGFASRERSDPDAARSDWLWAAKLYRQIGAHRAADHARTLADTYTAAPTNT